MEVSECSWHGTYLRCTILQNQSTHAPWWASNRSFFWSDHTTWAPISAHYTHLSDPRSLLVAASLRPSSLTTGQGRSVHIQCRCSKENVMLFFGFWFYALHHLAASRAFGNQLSTDDNLLFEPHKQRLYWFFYKNTSFGGVTTHLLCNSPNLNCINFFT